ncbi:uncharacterized protein AMSG_09523 [Thecamonas trahens ATCC 50062]|uniref:BZIP domain-containing protein n=1 Tax=Thecamonas trahens ATCC 50062 TaxID=461836 RepID=A0A0L0DP41_THETB|nr:hypothetical protein AMSG_09523 [Thecamonas trahens ATCC 50062]KNC53801.1 hypothetical protein AMSG_09523 [Thecamonas trahens ATCC 50062]|eukprot:XP_013754361.1 hypothetical protein AMSG_09523 [Thecamonas trahens ATCC 50062]
MTAASNGGEPVPSPPYAFHGASYRAPAAIAHFDDTVPVTTLPPMFSDNPSAAVPVRDPTVALNYQHSSSGSAPSLVSAALRAPQTHHLAHPLATPPLPGHPVKPATSGRKRARDASNGPAGGKSASDAPAVPVAKKQRRAAKNRIASKNYRQRRREYVQRIEQQLEELRAENERLKAAAGSGSAAVDVVLLQEENEALKSQIEALQAHANDVSDSGTPGDEPSPSTLSVEDQQVRLVELLHRNIVNGDDEAVVAANLKKLRALRAPRKISQADVLRQIEAEALAGSPAKDEYSAITQAIGELSKGGSEAAGASPPSLSPNPSPSPEPTSPVAQARKFSTANYLALSPAQQAVIDQLRSEHEETMTAIIRQRHDTTAKVKALLHSNFGLYTSLKAQGIDFNDAVKDIPDIADIANALNELKASIQAEADATESLMSRFLSQLTPRQEAVWELRVCQFSHCRSRVIQAFWSVAERASLDIEVYKCE